MFVSMLGRPRYENHESTDKLDYREANKRKMVGEMAQWTNVLVVQD